MVDRFRDGTDRTDRDAGTIEQRKVLLTAAFSDEGADDGVEDIAVGEPIVVRAKARIVDEIAAADRAKDPLGMLCIDPDKAT